MTTCSKNAPAEEIGGLMSIPDCCEFLSISRPTVYKLIASGKIRAVKFCGQRRIPRADVIQMVTNELKDN